MGVGPPPQLLECCFVIYNLSQLQVKVTFQIPVLISGGIYNIETRLEILVDAVELKSTLFPNIQHRL